MARLWDRGEPLAEAVLRLTVGRDPELDLRLLPWDCLASAAHARMLDEIGVLQAGEVEALVAELAAAARDALAGELTVDVAEEDGHTALENRLTERLGDAGRRIHTGRSRNDQVIAALRLWGRDSVLRQIDGTLAVAGRLLALAEEHRETTAPGYTHTRQAMSTTFGHYFAAWAENLLDDLPWLEAAFGHLDRSPLGSASGFGVALPLDRERVAELLGFASLQENTLAVQNDRGKTEYLALAAAAAAATDLGRLAVDLIAWSSDEIGFVELGAALVTGSSIMPQKRNPDVLELVRAGGAVLRSRQATVGAVYGSLGAGYHRDLQLTKEPFLEGMQGLLDLLTAMAAVLDGLTIDPRRAAGAVRPATGATDAAYARVRRGEPFRDAYKAVAAAPEEGAGAAEEGWRERRHRGAPGALDLAPGRTRLEGAAERLDAARRRLQAVPERVFGRPLTGLGD